MAKPWSNKQKGYNYMFHANFSNWPNIGQFFYYFKTSPHCEKERF